MVKTGTAPASIQRYSHCPRVGPGVSGWMEKKVPRTSPRDSCSTACRRSRWVVPARARDSRYCLHKEVLGAVWGRCGTPGIRPASCRHHERQAPVDSAYTGSCTTPGLQYANQSAECASKTSTKPEANYEVVFREPRLTNNFPCCNATPHTTLLLQSCSQQRGIIVSQPGRRRGLDLRRVAWQAQQLQHIHGCGWAAPGWRQLRNASMHWPAVSDMEGGEEALAVPPWVACLRCGQRSRLLQRPPRNAACRGTLRLAHLAQRNIAYPWAQSLVVCEHFK